MLLILVQEQNVLAQTQGAIPSNAIAIYKALGGGWQIRFGSQPDRGQAVVLEESLDQPPAPMPEASTLPPVPTDEP